MRLTSHLGHFQGFLAIGIIFYRYPYAIIIFVFDTHFSRSWKVNEMKGRSLCSETTVDDRRHRWKMCKMVIKCALRWDRERASGRFLRCDASQLPHKANVQTRNCPSYLYDVQILNSDELQSSASRNTIDHNSSLYYTVMELKCDYYIDTKIFT